jgi:transposase
MKKHIIHLTAEQRQALEALTRTGQASARTIAHAHILLKSDEGTWTDAQISQAFGGSEATIWRVRRRFLEGGLEEALHRRPQPERPQKRKITGEQEAHLVALVCSPPPAGYQRWSIRLVRKRVVELEIAEQVGRETIRQTLKKASVQ